MATVPTSEEQMVPEAGPRRVVSRARTAAAFPGRLVAVEDRCAALETRVADVLDEMRSELAEMRALLGATLDGQSDLAVLVGGLLAATGSRIDALESRLEGTSGTSRTRSGDEPAARSGTP
ncbi:MAG: hypothetical protein ACYCR4_01995 [Acidimicrobiales bacterium]